jgi:hypothetical protein
VHTGPPPPPPVPPVLGGSWGSRLSGDHNYHGISISDDSKSQANLPCAPAVACGQDSFFQSERRNCVVKYDNRRKLQAGNLENGTQIGHLIRPFITSERRFAQAVSNPARSRRPPGVTAYSGQRGTDGLRRGRAMVLAAIIPTADGAPWHGARSSTFPQFPTGSAAAGRQSLRLAGRSGSSATAAPPPPLLLPPPPPALAPAAPAQQHAAPEVAPVPASTNKRVKSDKSGKRKRDEVAAADRAALAQGEHRVKEKKEHDKYCHFCQVGAALCPAVGLGIVSAVANLW